jgi:hypothetical protein
MNAILDRVAEGRLHLGISCYIPYPSVYNEIKDFARHNNCDSVVLSKVDTWLVKKTPDRYKVMVPSKIFYEYVDYMRSRINKGMNISEEAVWESVSRCISLSEGGASLKEMKDEIEREIVGSIIRKFRTAPRTSTSCSWPRSWMQPWSLKTWASSAGQSSSACVSWSPGLFRS